MEVLGYYAACFPIGRLVLNRLVLNRLNRLVLNSLVSDSKTNRRLGHKKELIIMSIFMLYNGLMYVYPICIGICMYYTIYI